jgi:nitrate reductase alpha subunit
VRDAEVEPRPRFLVIAAAGLNTIIPVDISFHSVICFLCRLGMNGMSGQSSLANNYAMK